MGARREVYEHDSVTWEGIQCHEWLTIAYVGNKLPAWEKVMLTPETVTFIAIACSPAVLWGWSTAMRMRDSIPLSSSSDLLMAIVAFDLAASLDPTSFSNFVSNDPLKPYLRTVYIVALVASFLLWGYALHRLEPRVIASHRRIIHVPPPPTRPRMPYGEWILIWALSAIVIEFHLWMFSGALAPWQR